MAEVFLNLLEVAGWVIAYSAGGALTWKVVGSQLLSRFSDNTWDHGHPLPCMAGLFWPIGLPATLPFLTFSVIKKAKLQNLKLPFKRPAEQKVLEYAAAPVLILSQLIAQRITREFENLKVTSEPYPVWYWTSSDNRINLSVNCVGRSADRPLDIIRLTLDRASIDVERDIIINAVTKAVAMKIAKDNSEKEAARQLKALSAVESLLIPEKEQT